VASRHCHRHAAGSGQPVATLARCRSAGRSNPDCLRSMRCLKEDCMAVQAGWSGMAGCIVQVRDPVVLGWQPSRCHSKDSVLLYDDDEK